MSICLSFCLSVKMVMKRAVDEKKLDVDKYMYMKGMMSVCP